jgi:ADP-ribosylglycohydrolase
MEHPTLFDLNPSPRELLQQLWSQGDIAVQQDAVFDRDPEALPLEDLRAAQRVEGMLLGIAVGDSLGHSTEWQYDPETRHQQFGTIVDHVPDRQGRIGRVSDDTQMSFWTVERLLARGHFDFDDLASCFVNRRKRIVGRGKNTSAALERHAQRLRTGTPSLAGCLGNVAEQGRGNGGLMRLAPIVLPHLRRPSKLLWSDAVLSTYITHGHRLALIASVGFADLLWQALQRPTGEAPDPLWWLDRYVQVTRQLDNVPLPDPLNTDSSPEWFAGFRGSLSQFIDGPLRDAFSRGVSLAHACSLKGFGSRADCVQTVPACLYVLMSHADSFESAIIAAVNDTKDNDTIAAIVGAILGALHGKHAIRRKWIDGIGSSVLHIPGHHGVADRDLIISLAGQAQRTFLA